MQSSASGITRPSSVAELAEHAAGLEYPALWLTDVSNTVADP